jgi:hypothetical protein
MGRGKDGIRDGGDQPNVEGRRLTIISIFEHAASVGNVRCVDGHSILTIFTDLAVITGFQA